MSVPERLQLVRADKAIALQTISTVSMRLNEITAKLQYLARTKSGIQRTLTRSPIVRIDAASKAAKIDVEIGKLVAVRRVLVRELLVQRLKLRRIGGSENALRRLDAKLTEALGKSKIFTSKLNKRLKLKQAQKITRAAGEFGMVEKATLMGVMRLLRMTRKK